jgi:hypothetical protein
MAGHPLNDILYTDMTEAGEPALARNFYFTLAGAVRVGVAAATDRVHERGGLR